MRATPALKNWDLTLRLDARGVLIHHGETPRDLSDCSLGMAETFSERKQRMEWSLPMQLFMHNLECRVRADCAKSVLYFLVGDVLLPGVNGVSKLCPAAVTLSLTVSGLRIPPPSLFARSSISCAWQHCAATYIWPDSPSFCACTATANKCHTL